MSSYDDLDHEIDREMGWAKGKKPPSPRRGPNYWQALLRGAKASRPLFRPFFNLARSIGKVVFFPIITPLGYSKRFNVHGDMVVLKRSIPWRIADAFLTRLLLTPVILALFFIGLVYSSTHPRNVQAIGSPEAYGLYYKRVNLVSVDNQRLSGWFIPPMSADEVAFDPEGTLAQKWPGVVLCHGLGGSHDQYLPLARFLHTAGFAVLMLDMRGQGESDPAAVTYGLRERLDVLAGVKFLRETSYIDQTKVCVVGRNIGAMAVLQAAALDSSINAVVADGLWPRFEERAREIFGRPSPKLTGGDNLPTQWLAPLYTLAFDIGIRDRMSQLDPTALVSSIHTQPILFVARDGSEYAPIQEVFTLASKAGGTHEVILGNGDWERHICEFLIKNTHWKGPKARGADQIERLLRNRVAPSK